MAVADVLKMIQDNEVKFVDLRFTDTKGKEQHVTIPAHQVLPTTLAAPATCTSLVQLHR